MKSLDALAASHLRHLHRERATPWFDENDDEPTDKLVTLGAIVKPAIIVAPVSPLAALRLQLLASDTPAVVVMDGTTLVGLVTSRDLVRIPVGLAVDAMSRAIQTPATTPIERAAGLMSQAGVGEIVVVEIDGSVLGVVGALDVVRQFAITAGY